MGRPSRVQRSEGASASIARRGPTTSTRPRASYGSATLANATDVLSDVDKTLASIERLLREDRFEERETHAIELKPVPPSGREWSTIRESVAAFLNTAGGAVILGVTEEQQERGKRYRVTGWRADAEAPLRELMSGYFDRQGRPLAVPAECFPPPEIRDFMGRQLAVLYVEALPTERKFAFVRQRDGGLVAFRRVLTADKVVTAAELERQEELQQEALVARELQPVPGTSIDDVDLGKLNEFIYALNHPRPVETMKRTLVDARPFLERRAFVREGQVTTLGMLVCGRHPEDRLGFRCQLHGYVDVAQEIARDKQDFVGNVLSLMDEGLRYVLRNTRVGISPSGGGTSTPEYPEDVLRETINNALAHRDYGVDKQAFIAIKPGVYLQIRNPGRFRSHLLIEHDGPGGERLRRIVPEPKPRNPRLADVLRAYRKWEGRGIGMATLVSLCLEDRMGLPTYQVFTEEVALFLRPGKLLDARVEALFSSFDGYLREKLGAEPTREERLVLAYLVHAEWANQANRYAILLTPDNNHLAALRRLERAGLVLQHRASTPTYPVYVPDPTLLVEDYAAPLRTLVGDRWSTLGALEQQLLNAAYRAAKYAAKPTLSARTLAYDLWYRSGKAEDIKAFEAHYRAVRRAVGALADAGLLTRSGTRSRPEYTVAGVARDAMKVPRA